MTCNYHAEKDAVERLMKVYNRNDPMRVWVFKVISYMQMMHFRDNLNCQIICTLNQNKSQDLVQ